MCKQLITIKFGTFLISLFPFPELLRLFKMCNILGCLYGVWKVFGRHLGSVYVTPDTEWLLIQGGYNVQTPISLIFTSWFLFCQLPQIIQNGPYFGVSGGCLEGVLEVSGNYLSDPGYCLEGYVVGSIEKKIILGHFNQLRHFLTVANFRRFKGQKAKFICLILHLKEFSNQKISNWNWP